MKKITKKAILQIIVIVIIATITFFIGRQIGLNTDTSSTKTTIENVTVGTQTITKTLTGSGEIETATTEQVAISQTKYYETMCVEEDDIVESGANILKYTDGTYLTAPYDCLISSYSVPESGSIGTSSNYIEIKDMSNLVVSLSINENEISDLETGQSVEIELSSDSEKTYTGTITKIGTVATYQSSGSTFDVTVSFTNDGNAKLGMTASCTINIESLENVVAVPIDAVKINDDGNKYVTVIEDGKEKDVEIETGLSDDEYVQIESGLSGGETIQITTVTKESQTSSDSSNDMQDGFGGDMQDMPSGMEDMQIPSGGTGGDMQMPSMPEN